MNRFGEYVTSTAFHMRLSRRMIDALCHIDHFGDCFCTFATWRALHDRGLVEADQGVKEEMELGVYIMKFGGKISLTKAGELMMPLLREAGMYTDYSWVDNLQDDVAETPDIEIKLKPEFADTKGD